MPATYHLPHLRTLESEAIHVMREVAAEFEHPVLLFSGGKDSIVLLRLAEKAFRPAGFPFPVMHVDTGHNFPEAIEFRDRRLRELDERLIVASVEASIRKGRVVEETGPRASRNALQTVTLLDAISEHGFDAAFGGARRDEERARAKERILSFRDEFGQREPQRQRPEVWNLYNGRIRRGEHAQRGRRGDRRHRNDRARADARRRPRDRGGDGGSQAAGLLLMERGSPSSRVVSGDNGKVAPQTPAEEAALISEGEEVFRRL